MNNILNNHNPNNNLEGRLKFSVGFVRDVDIKGKRILNIGCGFGWFEVNALKRGVKKITGIEISKEDLAVAKKNVVNKKVSFMVGDATKLPFKDNSFDTVVSWEVIEHIPKNKENQMFSEMQRVLKKGGIVYISTPHRNFWSNLLDPAWWLIGHRHYSTQDFKGFAKKNFKIQKLIVRGKIWTAIDILNMYVSKWIFRRAPFFNKFISKMVDTEYKTEKGFANIFFRCKKL